MNTPELEKLIQRSTNETTYCKIRTIIDEGAFKMTNLSRKPIKLYQKSVLSIKDKEYSKPQKNLGAYSSSKLPDAIGSGSNDREESKKGINMEYISVINSKIVSPFWKTRMEAIDSLADFIQKNSTEVNESTKFIQILDSFIKVFNDSNTKVALKGLEVFEKVIPYMKTGLEQNLTPLMVSLSNNLSSTTTLIKNKADVIIDLLIDTVESQYLVQPLVHLCLYGNSRSKSILIAFE